MIQSWLTAVQGPVVLYWRVMLLLVLGVIHSAVAGNTDQWQASTLVVDDGLPSLTVYSMAQDQAGYLWFGTTNGLARYDGYSFKVYRHDGADKQSLSNNNAGNIFIDSKNNLWVGTFGGGANKLSLNQGQLTRFPYSSTNLDEMIAENVQTFMEDSRGNMWIGTGSGLYQLNADELRYFSQPSNDANTINQSRVWDLEEDNHGHIWASTSYGLSQLDVETGEFNQFTLPDELSLNILSNQFRTLKKIGEKLWVGSATGLYSFDLQAKRFEFHPASTEGIKINDIYADNEGQLLLASMDGVYAFNLQLNDFETDEFGQLWQIYSHLDVRQIQRDRAGLLWLATRDNGVVKIDQAGGLFQFHTEYMSELDDIEKSKQVWSIAVDTSNNIYLGTSDTVFKQAVSGKSERMAVAGFDDVPGIIRSIKPKLSGGFWVASSAGLYALSADKNQIVAITEPFNLVGIKPADIFSVAETDTGELWLALYNLGVLRWDPTQKTAQLLQAIADTPLTDRNISVIFVDQHQHIWIGSNLTGVFRFNPEEQQLDSFNHEFGNDQSISSNRIRDIFEDSSGQLWIATARGLNKYNKKDMSFEQYSVADGLLVDSINAVLEDSKQNLWVVSQYGLSRYNPEKREINNYILNEGANNFGFGNRSSAIDDNDVIYLGSVNGYYTFDSKLLKQNSSYQPPLVMTQAWINGQPAVQAQKMQYEFDLFNDDQSIAFEFAALDFKSPEQIKYRYRMNGLNEEWMNISSNRLIELNNLNPGGYQLEIKAVNNDGRWSEQTMLVNLNVHPVWWTRTWVRILFVALIMMLIVFFHKLRTHKIRKQNLVLEREVKSRTSELHDLNVQLKSAAHSDYLTKLPNRMAFIKNVEFSSQQQVDCIVMADIDYFKQINDQYGHAAGDLILVKVAALMQTMIREDDLVARWGGEEFIFYFKNKQAHQVTSLVDRIRTTIENTAFKYDDTVIAVTMTFGVCERQAGMNLNECIIKADEAMYAGKAQGRNAVILADGSKVA